MDKLYSTTRVQRDEKGRFAIGNTICYAGFSANLQRNFSGDREAYAIWLMLILYKKINVADFMQHWRLSTPIDNSYIEPGW